MLGMYRAFNSGQGRSSTALNLTSSLTACLNLCTLPECWGVTWNMFDQRCLGFNAVFAPDFDPVGYYGPLSPTDSAYHELYFYFVKADLYYPRYYTSGAVSYYFRPSTRCNNGQLEPCETCDDGNSDDGGINPRLLSLVAAFLVSQLDGCSSQCLVELGWTCQYGTVSTCTRMSVTLSELIEDWFSFRTSARLSFIQPLLLSSLSRVCRWAPSGY